jgi:hypothetical protein
MTIQQQILSFSVDFNVLNFYRFLKSKLLVRRAMANRNKFCILNFVFLGGGELFVSHWRNDISQSIILSRRAALSYAAIFSFIACL